MAERWTHWGGGPLPPEPPRPGVISPRPLRTGDILGGAFAALARYGIRLVAAMFLGQLAALLLVAAATGAALALHARPVAALVPAAALGALLTCALAAAVSTAALQRAVLGRPATVVALLRAALPRYAAVLGAQLLVLAAVAGPGAAVLAAGLPPLLAAATLPAALGLGVLFALAPTAAAYESLGPIAALRRSARLVRGSWWRTLGITALAAALTAGTAYAVRLPFAFAGALSLLPALDGGGVHAALAALGGTVAQTLLLCFPQLTAGLVYADRRIRREGLAAELDRQREELGSA
ncbi:hypothetical protein J7F03_23890 [Streptomyces sp. ISL-43]|uniref:hypothetical protein n=1 Tax=Streptomyces sp. ISL-43 TaxID=2819183 RepID=UPI001BE9CB4F|nr:hypothetical protein [Streptomyces sp. ISL-43]MBT2450059.1 hypothetical protein [Streptomyces sp. ISL-43]